MSTENDLAQGWKSPFYSKQSNTEAVAQSLLLGHTIRAKANQGLAVGTFVIDLPNASTITALSLAGFDFVVLDMEHSSIDFGQLESLINASRAASLAVLVRPWGQDTGLIGKILDLGAHGVMVPHVDNADRARSVVEQTRFSPLGDRGYSPLTKFDAIESPLKELNESTYVVVQIEGQTGLNNVEEIAAVPGIDAVFIGPYDLSLALGVEPGNEKVFSTAREIARSVPESLGMGIYIDNPAKCAEWAANGFGLQCVSYDGRMLSDAARSVVHQARQGTPSAKNESLS